MRYTSDLQNRLLNFAVTTIKFLTSVPHQSEYVVIIRQLSKSASSIGANYRESQSSSYKEFAYKTRIALREANETIYWLELLDRLGLGDQKLRKLLLEDIHQITLILGSIVSKALKRIKTSKKNITN